MTRQPDKTSEKTGASAQDRRQVSPEQRQRKARTAFLSILSNSLLVTLKLGVGLWSGSVSVLSEALHSAIDLVASGIAFFSVRVSDTPPDDNHPYGHGKIESLSGLAESLLIFLAAAFIVHEAVDKLRDPGHIHTAQVDAGMAVMALSAVINIVLSRYLFRVGRETDSMALEADAEHLRTDVLTSVGVLAGLALTRLTGQLWFDPLTALLVALLIIHTGYRLTREAVSPLLDVRLPPEDEAAIQEVLETDERVLGYHKLRTRKAGSHRHVDVHVQIDDHCTLLQAHDLTEELEDRIREALPATQINIHIEPYQAEMQHQREAHGLNVPAFPTKDKPLPAPKNGTETTHSREGGDADSGTDRILS